MRYYLWFLNFTRKEKGPTRLHWAERILVLLNARWVELSPAVLKWHSCMMVYKEQTLILYIPWTIVTKQCMRYHYLIDTWFWNLILHFAHLALRITKTLILWIILPMTVPYRKNRKVSFTLWLLSRNVSGRPNVNSEWCCRDSQHSSDNY